MLISLPNLSILLQNGQFTIFSLFWRLCVWFARLTPSKLPHHTFEIVIRQLWLIIYLCLTACVVAEFCQSDSDCQLEVCAPGFSPDCHRVDHKNVHVKMCTCRNNGKYTEGKKFSNYL